MGQSRHHAIPARPLRLKRGHQTRGQSRPVAFESVEEQPRTSLSAWSGSLRLRARPILATDISPTSVHRAMRAVARAEAKREIAVLKIMEVFLEKAQRGRSKGRGIPISARP